MPPSLDGHSKPTTSEPADETPQIKKHILSRDSREASTVKRVKVVKDAPKKPSVSQGSVKVRIPTTKRRGADLGSGEVRWSVAPSSDSPRVVSPESLKRTDVQPRLWSSNREELLSTFAEISGPRCVNNISWASTDMPILILEDEFVTLEKPEVDNELCMDVIFVREFAFATSHSLPEADVTATPNVYEPVANISSGIESTQPMAPVIDPAATIESRNKETKDAVLPSAEVSISTGRPSAEKPGAFNRPSPSHSSPAPIATTQNPKRKREPTRSEVVIPRPKEHAAPSTSEFQTTNVEHKKRKTGSVYSNMHFKKNLSIAPDTPTNINSMAGVEPPPQDPPALDSNLPRPLLPPEASFSEWGSVPTNQTNFEPAFPHYSDSHAPPQAHRLLASLPGKFAVPLPTPHPQYLTGVPRAEGERREPIDIISECRCGFNPGCQVCCGRGQPIWGLVGPGEPTNWTGPEEHPSAQVWHPSMATFPNNIPLGRPSRFRHLCAVTGPSKPWDPRGGRPQYVFGVPPCPSPTIDQLAAPNLGGNTAGAPEVGGNTLMPLSMVQTTCAIAGSSRPQDWHENMLQPDIPKPVLGVHSRPHAVAYQQPAPDLNYITGSTSTAALIHPFAPCTTGVVETAIKGALQRNEAAGTANAIGSFAPSPAPLYDGSLRPTAGVEPIVSPPSLTVNGTSGESFADMGPSRPSKRKGKEGKEAIADAQSSSSAQQTTGPRKRGRPPKKPKLDAGAELIGTHQNSTQAHASALQPPPSTFEIKIEDNGTVMHPDFSSPEGGNPTAGVPEPGLVAGTKTPPSSVVTSLKKRRRTPPNTKTCSQPIQPNGSTTAMQTDPVESQTQPHSPQPSNPGSIPKFKSKSRFNETRLGENGIPSPIPDEFRALVNAYISGLPVGMFAARKHLHGFWGLRLAREEEIGYMFMGFYRISRVWETLGGSDGRQQVIVENGFTKGHVRWRFRMKWEPGGEDLQGFHQEKLLSPWWNAFARAGELVALPQPDLEDSDDESTLGYRLARRKNHNFPRRHCFFGQVFYSVLPLHLLAPVDAEIPDSSFPRGWYCGDCGKLNFRYYLRHRRCESSFCKNKPTAEGYAIDLESLRDPQDVLPLTLPINEYPKHINMTVQNWSNHMKTVIYRLNAEHSAVLQQIFTCNLRDLQKEASDLLNKIQIHVPLRRLTGDASTNPFFTYFAGGGRERGFVRWEDVPECLVRTRTLMNERGRKYGRKTAAELDIKQLAVRAWVTSGSRRGPDLLRAKERCVAIMCLGCEVIMSISPKSISNDNQARIPDYDKMIPMDDSPESKSEVTTRAGAETKEELSRDINAVTLPAPAVATGAGAVSGSQKGGKMVISVSLIHGDILLLEGDEFEYSLKRNGTSILLFGT